MSSGLRALSATWRARYDEACGYPHFKETDAAAEIKRCADDLDAALGSPTAQEGTPSALHTASRKGE